MYAAAGGASLASRQARQRQRQQKKTQQLQAKLHPTKAPELTVHGDHGIATPTRHSRQFHQLPTNYLRTPHAQVRKLSAGYTTQSKFLLPIDESGDTQSFFQMRMHSHAHGHGHGHEHVLIHGHSHTHLQQQHHHSHLTHYTGHGRISPRLGHRYSGRNDSSVRQTYLPKSASATIPLILQDQETTPPPNIQDDPLSDVAAEKQPRTTDIHTYESDSDNENKEYHQKQQFYRQQDQQQEQLPPTGQLERKCSVYRMKELDANTISEGVKRQLKELQFSSQKHQRYEPLLSDEPQMIFKALPPPQPQPSDLGRKSQICAYCEEGICTCEHTECAQGRAAWLERGRRCSVQEAQQVACHRRWVKRNRIKDASLGGSSDDEDMLSVLRGPSTFANTFLYVGLGTIAVGLVIAFVGTGEKGFKTIELRLIGPSLIGLGFICCMLRILFCICPSHCLVSSKKNIKQKTFGKIDADHTTSLLCSENRRVSIARDAHHPQRYPFSHKRTNAKMLNEGMEALRQIATTSLFMQSEQKLLTKNRIVPIIKEPDNMSETPLEMKKLNSTMKSGVERNLITKGLEGSGNQTGHQLNQIDSKLRDKEDTGEITASIDALTLQRDTYNKILTVDNATDLCDNYTSNNALLPKIKQQEEKHQELQHRSQPQQLLNNHINTPELSLSHLPSASSEVQNRNEIETTLSITDKIYHFDKSVEIIPITMTRAMVNATTSKTSRQKVPIHRSNVQKNYVQMETKSIEMSNNHISDVRCSKSTANNSTVYNKNLNAKYTTTSIRGPLGIPTHLLNTILTATTAATTASATIKTSSGNSIYQPTENTYNSDLIRPPNSLDVSTTSKLITTIPANLTGQVEDDDISKVIVKIPIKTVPTTTAITATAIRITNGCIANNLLYPTSSPTNYTNSDSTLPLHLNNFNTNPNNIIYTTFTTSISSTSIARTTETELLLSPAKLGR